MLIAAQSTLDWPFACYRHNVQDPPRLGTLMDSFPPVECTPVTEPSKRPSGKIDEPGVRGDEVMLIDSVAIR